MSNVTKCPTIYALLKSTQDEKPAQFHGVTTLLEAAEAWMYGSNENWYQEFTPNDEGYISDPSTAAATREVE